VTLFLLLLLLLFFRLRLRLRLATCTSWATKKKRSEYIGDVCDSCHVTTQAAGTNKNKKQLLEKVRCEYL
jgi:hypothetical protein